MNNRMLKARRAALILTIGALGACTGLEEGIAPLVPESDALGIMSVSPNALIMAVGQTRQIEITASTLTGVPITSFDTVVYQFQTGADSSRVSISPTGLITAKETAALVRINVIVSRNRQYKGAQVLLQVTPTEVGGATLSIQPTDSTRLAAGSYKTIAGTVENAGTGESVPNPVIRYSVRPEDSDRIQVHQSYIYYGGLYLDFGGSMFASPNQIVALTGGADVWVFGTVDAYGTVLRDSTLYTLTYPFSSTIAVQKTVGAVTSVAKERVITLAPGATVTFRSSVPGGDPLTIAYTFDDPAGAGTASPASTVGGASGNVTPLAAGQQTRRRFMTPGTYRWTATATGGPTPWAGQTLSGTIEIK